MLELIYSYALDISIFFTVFFVLLVLGVWRGVGILTAIIFSILPTLYLVNIFPYTTEVRDIAPSLFDTTIAHYGSVFFIFLIFFFLIRKVTTRNYTQKKLFSVILATIITTLFAFIFTRYSHLEPISHPKCTW